MDSRKLTRFEITRDALLFDIKFKTLDYICMHGFK